MATNVTQENIDYIGTIWMKLESNPKILIDPTFPKMLETALYPILAYIEEQRRWVEESGYDNIYEAVTHINPDRLQFTIEAQEAITDIVSGTCSRILNAGDELIRSNIDNEKLVEVHRVADRAMQTVTQFLATGRYCCILGDIDLRLALGLVHAGESGSSSLEDALFFLEMAIKLDDDKDSTALAKKRIQQIRQSMGETASGTDPSIQELAQFYIFIREGKLNRVNEVLDRYPQIINIRFSNNTPLTAAAAEGQLEIVKLLVARGANITLSDGDGDPPVKVAAILGKKAVMEYLISMGAPMDQEATLHAMTKKSGCYIATACYGNFDHPDVVLFRRYRDQIMLPTTSGRLFVSIYYKLSPPIASRIGKVKWLSSAIRKWFLEPLARRMRL